jgi:signal transduction histidine kinase
MSWLSPRTVRGWFVLIVLGALIVSQLASLALLASQQTFLRSALHEAEAFRRTAGIVRLAKDADEKTRQTLEETASGPSFLVRFGSEPLVAASDRNVRLSKALARNTGSDADAVRVAWEDALRTFRFEQFEEKIDGRHTIIITGDGPTVVPLEAVERIRRFKLPKAMKHNPVAPHQPMPSIPSMPPIPPVPPIPPIAVAPAAPGQGGPDWVFTAAAPVAATTQNAPDRLDISVAMGPSLWLNVSALPPAVPSVMWPMILTGVLAVVLVAIAAVWAAGRVARPIAGLTAAAERLGRGDALFLAPEEGPQDVRAAASAFNTMAARLRRLIEDQRALLSAVGHDLRTPIASLRIRTELIKDPELQGRMLSSLSEMERLTEAALAAARGGESGEPTRPVDLPSLIEAVCDDLADTGSPVTFATLPAARVEGRASELRRALRNLIENAVRYGLRARVSMTVASDSVSIDVDDDGPGIPDDKLGDVTKPFVRLEESRSVETGGHGLGLTIARAIVERHGGELLLSNRAEGGLRATLKIPVV